MDLASKRKLIAIAVILVVAGGLFFASRLPPKKSKALDSVIAELVDFKRAHGVYPSDPKSLESIRELEKDYSLYFGIPVSDKKVNWRPQDVSDSDLTILITNKTFLFFAPTGRMKMISFSNFPVWRYTSDQMKWRKGKIHWSLMYVYWSED